MAAKTKRQYICVRSALREDIHTPCGEELQPLGSLVFAETIQDLSFHPGEGGRENKKTVKFKPELLP